MRGGFWESFRAAFGTKTKECKCRENSEFGSDWYRCYNHAAFVKFLPIKSERTPPEGLLSPMDSSHTRGMTRMRRLCSPGDTVVCRSGYYPTRRCRQSPHELEQRPRRRATAGLRESLRLLPAGFQPEAKGLAVPHGVRTHKFLAAASHVHRGQLLRESGKLDEAVAEFQKAGTIDPSSFIAQQELQKTQEMISQANNPQQAVAPTPNLLKKILTEAQGPVELSNRFRMFRSR